MPLLESSRVIAEIFFGEFFFEDLSFLQVAWK